MTNMNNEIEPEIGSQIWHTMGMNRLPKKEVRSDGRVHVHPNVTVELSREKM